ncbi:hypothetical protein EDD29_3806 [Actinocorallia herbida]|uniref:Uncharacterized protein n=1 Tax=Actinocorallia herbida TaxID=58109 RepID=A0A3N1CY72_9ACTN|nr:hypothetical protein [Actinocorallia herbida]ROO86243.1 hypothetical protein EDD29_3806 [Actinocorallia herbida]
MSEPPMTPGEDAPQRRIAMWGTPGSGKTTFLAALKLALSSKTGASTWRLFGRDPASDGALRRLTNSMIAEVRTFPSPTQNIDRYSWILQGNSVERVGGWGRKQARSRTVRISLDLVDVSGELYLSRDVPSRGQDALVEDLAESRGIIFLFDPIREYDRGDAFEYFHGVIGQLNQRTDPADFVNGYLPHHMAVCVTKFDSVRVMQTALRSGLITYDPDDRHGFPSVADHEAEKLFKRLCDIAADGYGAEMINEIKANFHPDRVKFFVTSAIGFYTGPSNLFDEHDYQNTMPNPDPADARPVIRGKVSPINVMEPLIWLGGKLAADSGPGV